MTAAGPVEDLAGRVGATDADDGGREDERVVRVVPDDVAPDNRRDAAAGAGASRDGRPDDARIDGRRRRVGRTAIVGEG